MFKNKRRAVSGLGLVTAIAASLAVTAPAALADSADRSTGSGGAATASDTALQDDFNGDGYSDVVLPVPAAGLESGEANHDGGGAPYDGYVAVMYGSADGLQTDVKQVFDENKPGIPGDADQFDSYGSSVTSADLDRDGYADLIVGAVGEGEGGAVSVIWGGSDGLSGSTWLTKGTEWDDRIGGLVVAGDFDGDGVTDVASSTEGHNLRVLTGPFDRAGTPAGGTREVPGPAGEPMNDLAAGDVNGDGVTDIAATGGRVDTSRVAYWQGGTDGLTQGTAVSDLDGAGNNLDIGDVNGDHHDDLVIGRPNGNITSDDPLPEAKGGMVSYVPGGPDGPDPAGTTRFNQDSPGVPGVAEVDADGNNDEFGTGVSVGDIDGDGYADVSVGVRDESFDGIQMPGSVVTMRGTADGLTGQGAKVFSEATPGVPGIPQDWDAFGSATKLTDTNGDGMTDLVVGCAGEGEMGDEDVPDGSIWVLRSTADGVTADGAITFGVHTLGVPPRSGGMLGSEFAT